MGSHFSRQASHHYLYHIFLHFLELPSNNLLQIEFETQFEEDCLKATQGNEGRYDIDSDGMLVLKNGNPSGPIYGLPFSNIGPNDPKVAEKVMENFKFSYYRYESSL